MCPDEEIQTARVLAPEDIRSGDYVAVLHVIREHRPAPWECPDAWQIAPIRRLELPHPAMVPVQVLEVCLPLLLVRTPQGKHRVVDVRRFRLARLAESFGQKVFERYAADQEAEQTAEAKAESTKAV